MSIKPSTQPVSSKLPEKLLSNGKLFCQTADLLAMRALGSKLLLSAPKRTQSMMAGNVLTRYKGRGMSFAEVRPYQPGDDIRTIDWRVTARTQKPYTKLFEEERERPVFLLIDMRSSMFFGSQHRFKCVHAALMAAAIAWSASAAGDRIGAMILSDDGSWDLRPKRGKNAVLALINALVDANRKLSNPAATSSRSLVGFLEDAKRIIRPGSMAYIISDAHDAEGLVQPLATLSRHTDIHFIQVFDPIEAELPHATQYTVSDGKTRTPIDGKVAQRRFGELFQRQQNALTQAVTQAQIVGLRAPVVADLEGWLLEHYGKGKRRPKRQATQGLAANGGWA